VRPVSGKLQHAEITEQVLRAFYEVYNELGHGFLEKVYENALAMALRARGLSVQQQAPVSVRFRGELVGEYYADLLVNNVVVLEVKAARAFEPAHRAQLLHYLAATEVEVGLLLNFGQRPEFKRLAFGNERKKRAGSTVRGQQREGPPGA